MASKTILLLLIGIFAVEVFSVKNCPHPEFLKKHVCTYCSNDINKIKNRALEVEAEVMRLKFTPIQTIYSTRKTGSSDWTDADNVCKSKVIIPRFSCIKKWSCKYEKDDWATHRLGKRCPENQNLCWDCLKDGVKPPDGPLTEHQIEQKKVDKKALETERDRYNRIKSEGKKYIPIYEQDVYVLKDIGESLSGFWHSPIDDRQNCKLKQKRPKYKCEGKWTCSVKGQGYGNHQISDGHLIERLHFEI